MVFKRLKNVIRAHLSFSELVKFRDLDELESPLSASQTDRDETHYYRQDDLGTNKGHKGTYEDSCSSQSQENGETTSKAKYCANLEIEETASIEEIRSQYRKLLVKYHPDKFNGNTEQRVLAEQVTKKLNEAYAYLCQKNN